MRDVIIYQNHQKKDFWRSVGYVLLFLHSRIFLRIVPTPATSRRYISAPRKVAPEIQNTNIYYEVRSTKMLAHFWKNLSPLSSPFSHISQLGQFFEFAISIQQFVPINLSLILRNKLKPLGMRQNARLLYFTLVKASNNQQKQTESEVDSWVQQ